MSSSSRARITNIATDTAYGYWRHDEDGYTAPTTHNDSQQERLRPSPGASDLQFPGFDQSYPFSAFTPVGRPQNWNTYRDDGRLNSGPAEASPMLPQESDHDDYHVEMTSVASPLYSHDYYTEFPHTPPPVAVLPPLSAIPTSYDPHRQIEDKYAQNLGIKGPSQRIKRQDTLAKRLSSRLLSRRKSVDRWGTVNRRSKPIDEEKIDESTGTKYMELGNVEERDEPIGVDISSFGPEYAVPNATAVAMEKQGWNEDLVYTGSGEAIDLTSLTGLDGDNRRSSDNFSMRRAGTMENTAQQSFYFAPGRHVPNWKPVVLKTWYLSILIGITVALLVGVEVLYQFSDRHVFRKGEGRMGGGLFAYVDIQTLTVAQFAFWKYLPTIVGVVYGIVWKVTDEELKRAEPYYQLSKGAKGALAAESLNIEYHTIWSPMVPVSALKYRQFVVAAGGVISFLASSAVPVFLSVFIRVDPSQKERKKMPDGGKSAIKRLVVDSVWTRLLEATLIVILILAGYVVYKLTHRRSGLMWDPSGIAGVAAMANKSHILTDFHNLDLATESSIHKQLNKRTYVLHKGALWQAQCLKEAERDNSAPKAMNPHPILLRVKGMGPFLVFCTIVLISLPVIVCSPSANVVIDKTPWIITGVSVLIKTFWELLEKEMRMLEPFWVLFKRNAPSAVLTLDYTATMPVYIVIKALTKGHLLLAWVTLNTILIEVLTVVMGSLDVQGGEESTLSSKLSFALAIVILAITIFTGLLVLKKRRHPFLPRQPGTISSVLAFIYQSKMLLDFIGTEQASTLAKEKKLANIGHMYGFGWYLGRDGQRHLGIDHEPLLEGYQFGKDPRHAVVDVPVGWDNYENGS